MSAVRHAPLGCGARATEGFEHLIAVAKEGDCGTSLLCNRCCALRVRIHRSSIDRLADRGSDRR